MKNSKIIVAGKTDPGKNRQSNQDRIICYDSFVLNDDAALIGVADGMGGHKGGEVASDLALQTFIEFFINSPKTSVTEKLTEAVQKSNKTVNEKAKGVEKLTGMGTTLTVGFISTTEVFVVNVGDSRAYVIDSSGIHQITDDHSWVAEQVKNNLITYDQALQHPMKNLITRAIGIDPEVKVDLFVEPINFGDIILICSDGLHQVVSDKEIENIVTSSEPTVACDKLISLANNKGGPDNIAVTIAKIMKTD